MKKRVGEIDLIKGIAIFLVVFGHSIQYGSGSDFLKNSLFFQNNIFKIIYSFHMPLFMLVSGFLFYGSKDRDFKTVLFSKIRGLLLPIFFWQTLFYIFFIILFQKNEFGIKNCLGQLINGLWFLWAVFYSSIVVSIISKCQVPSAKYLHIVLIGLTFILPDIFNLHLYKYVYPYFLIGYYWNENREKFKSKDEYKFFIGFLIVFGILISRYTNDSYIYTSKYSLIFNSNPIKYQLLINIYRFVIGLVGSVCMLYIVSYLNKILSQSSNVRKVIENLGKESLGIYIISGYLFSIMSKINFTNELNYFYTLLQSIFLITLCLILLYFIKKIKLLNIILLGGKK